jgi:hypothetical protein
MPKDDPNSLTIRAVEDGASSGRDVEKVFAGSTVPEKYRGTADDQNVSVVRKSAPIESRSNTPAMDCTVC